jgi:hypothetical protein
MKDQDELEKIMRSVYFNGVDQAGIEKAIEAIEKDVDREYHVCIATRSTRHSVSLLII